MQKAWRVQGLKRSLPKQKGLSFTRSGGGQAVNRACAAPEGDQGQRMARYAVYGYRLWESGLQNAQRTGSWQMFSSLSPKASWSAWFTNVCLKRGLATHGHAEDQDEAMLGSDSDDNTSTTSSLDEFASVEDSMNENSVSENQQNLTFSPLKDEDQDSMDDEAEGLCDDVETMGEAGDFKSGSLLDVAAGDITKKSDDKVQPLWLRIEQAARKKSYALKTVIDSWLAEGHATSREEMIFTITALRRQAKYRRALEVSDWVMTEKPFQFTDMDYAIRVEMISKVHGLQKAVNYFATIPKSFRSAMTYSILLQAYVDKKKMQDAEKLISEVEKQGLGHLAFMNNQLLWLYKRSGQMGAFAQLLQKMDEQNIEPDIYTYNLILDIRGRKGDIGGMEKVWREIENNSNVNPDAASFCILARNYATAGFLDKAEKATKKIETIPCKKKREVHRMLLKLYGQLGKADEVERIWGLITGFSKVLMCDYLIAIDSLGKVGEIERAEETFNQMIAKIGRKNVRQYNALLSVYSKQGMIRKTEDMMKEILKSSFLPGPSTFHHVIQMYARAGKVEKAMETLHKLQKTHQGSFKNKVWYASFQALLEMFAEQGDVQNAEKIIKNIKQTGYVCTFNSYRSLLKAYVKSETTPYGFIDRMHADGAIPNFNIRSELKKVDGT